LLSRPRPKVGQLTALRAEGAPRIAFPDSRPVAQRAGHVGILPHL